MFKKQCIMLITCALLHVQAVTSSDLSPEDIDKIIKLDSDTPSDLVEEIAKLEQEHNIRLQNQLRIEQEINNSLKEYITIRQELSAEEKKARHGIAWKEHTKKHQEIWPVYLKKHPQADALARAQKLGIELHSTNFSTQKQLPQSTSIAIASDDSDDKSPFKDRCLTNDLIKGFFSTIRWFSQKPNTPCYANSTTDSFEQQQDLLVQQAMTARQKLETEELISKNLMQKNHTTDVLHIASGGAGGAAEASIKMSTTDFFEWQKAQLLQEAMYVQQSVITEEILARNLMIKTKHPSTNHSLYQTIDIRSAFTQPLSIFDIAIGAPKNDLYNDHSSQLSTPMPSTSSSLAELIEEDDFYRDANWVENCFINNTEGSSTSASTPSELTDHGNWINHCAIINSEQSTLDIDKY